MDRPVSLRLLVSIFLLLSFVSCTHPARSQWKSLPSPYDYRPIGRPSHSSELNPSNMILEQIPSPPPSHSTRTTSETIISFNVTVKINESSPLTPSAISFSPPSESSPISPSASAFPFSPPSEGSPHSPSASFHFNQTVSTYFNQTVNITVGQPASVSPSPSSSHAYTTLAQAAAASPHTTAKITRRGGLNLLRKIGIAVAVIVVSLVILIAVFKAFKYASHNDNGNNLEGGKDRRTHTVMPFENASRNENGNNLEGGEDRRTHTVMPFENASRNENGNNLEWGEDRRAHTVREVELNSSKVGIDIRTYTLQELIKATNNFETGVGKGVSGSVYRANLPGDRMAAVKKADKLNPTLFKQELSVLLRLPRHPHLVDLIGLCLEPGEQILIFEYISNGNLAERLHKNEGNKGPTGPLSWAARMDIAYQVAVALQYLHEEIKPPILHRDIKSANVLLVDDNCAKLADFGLSKLGPKDNQSTVTQIRGTPSYWDPHYVKTRKYSAKSDVYSFGVLLLELITGLKSEHDDTPLAEWTQTYRSEGIDRFLAIIDQNMRDHINMMELQNMIKIANLCLQDIIGERPSMREIVNMMQETRNINGNLSAGAETPFLGNGNDGDATGAETPFLGNGNDGDATGAAAQCELNEDEA